MEARLKRPIIEGRIERLKAHLENVDRPQPGFQRELAKAESELQALDERKE